LPIYGACQKWCILFLHIFQRNLAMASHRPIFLSVDGHEKNNNLKVPLKSPKK
jgi:hypothetical protein